MNPSPTIEHDLRIVLAIQALRAFGYGFASVALGASLAERVYDVLLHARFRRVPLPEEPAARPDDGAR